MYQCHRFFGNVIVFFYNNTVIPYKLFLFFAEIVYNLNVRFINYESERNF